MRPSRTSRSAHSTPSVMGPHTPLMSSCTTSRLEACGTGAPSELTEGRGSSHASHAPHRSPSMRPRAGGLWELQVRTRTAGGPRRRLHEPSHPVPVATRHAPSASEPVPQRWHAPQPRLPPPATRVDGPVRNALLLSTHRFLARPIKADPEPANGRDGNCGGQQTDANPLDDRRHGTSSRRNAFLEQCVHRRRTFDMVLESGEDITHDADELVLTAGEHVDRHLRPLGDVPIQGPSDEPTVQSDERL